MGWAVAQQNTTYMTKRLHELHQTISGQLAS